MKKSSNNKNDFAAILKPYNEDIKRHMSALSEEFQGRVEGVAEMIGQLMVDMTEVKNGLKAKVTQDDFARLEKRVVRLETKVR